MNNLDKLQALLKELRHEKIGCAWTREQDFNSLAPHTIEESYELLDAIQQGDMTAIKHELGDLLYHVLFYVQIAEENQLFTLDDLAKVMLDKHEQRMPSPEARINMSAEETNAHWQALKAKQRPKKSNESLLDGIATTLPALLQAFKLQQRAADVGFDWPETIAVITKIQEELDELLHELNNGAERHKITEEAGDLLFSCVNLLRHLHCDPETALHSANLKFIRRFQYIEQRLAQENCPLQQASLETLETLWQEAKQFDPT